SGCFASMAAIAESGRPSCTADGKVPGQTALIRSPSCAYSRAATRVRWTTPALDAQYGAACDQAVSPLTEAMLTIETGARFRRVRATARMPWKVPVRLIDRVRCHSSVDTLWMRALGDTIP